MSETRNIAPGVFVGGDAGAAPPPGGVTSFNGRVGAVVSESGDYLAAVRFSVAAEIADFAAIEGVLHVVDSASTDPPITMLLPAAPTDKAVVGFVFNQPVGPFGPTAGLTLDPNGNSIGGNPGTFFFHTRFPNGALLLVWSALSSTWEITNWTDFILSQGATDDPQVMVRRSDAFGRLLFPLTMTPNSIVMRPDALDVVAQQLNAPSILANFAAKAYTSQDGLGGYSREAFAEQYNTLLPWFGGVPIAGDTTLIVNRAYVVAPPADTVVTLTLPAVADLVGGEQIAVTRQSGTNGAFRLDALAAAIVVPGYGTFSAPPNTLFACNGINSSFVLQYDAQTGAWILFGGDAGNLYGRNLEPFRADLAAGVGQVVDIPGPAVGFIRLFLDGVQLTSAVVAAPLVGVTMDVIDAALVAYRVTSQLTGTFTQNGSPHGIGNGEIVRVTNNGATAGHVSTWYVDVPVNNLALVRMLVTNAAGQVAIAAPAAGLYRRWLQSPQMTSTTRSEQARVAVFNRDTITHQMEVLLTGTLFARTQIINGNNVGSWPQTGDIAVTAASGDLEVRTTLAITTNPFVLVGIVETLGIQP